MLSNAQREHIGSLVRPMQIIVFALTAGIATFIAVVATLPTRDQQAGQALREPIISYIAIGAAVMALIAWAIVPRLLASSMRQAIVDGRPQQYGGLPETTEEMRQINPLIAVYQTTLIIGCAILEGAGFFNAVAYMLEHQQLNLLAAAVLAVMILMQFPTASRVVSWIEDESATIDRLRSMQ
jgi:hypothetical protein